MNENKKCPLAFSAIAKNPVLVLFLGACPAMAQTGSVISPWVWASPYCW